MVFLLISKNKAKLITYEKFSLLLNNLQEQTGSKVEAPMEEAQAKTNDIRDTIKAEILVRGVEGLTAGTYIIHWASVLSNHFDITGFKKVYGDLYKAFYRLPSKLFNFTPLTKYRYFVILILRYANAFVHIIRSLVFRKR